MVGLMERVRRHVQARTFAPMMLLVIAIPARPDPIAKRVGSAGVLPIPGPAVSAPAAGNHIDPIAEPRRDTRADRGRVLYAAGRAPRDTAAAPKATHKPCAEQGIVQAGRAPSSPNS